MYKSYDPNSMWMENQQAKKIHKLEHRNVL